MSVVGVDFGSTNAVIASAGRGGVDVILNGNSNRLNPCMVGFREMRCMGEAAAATYTSNYKNTVTDMKRLIGLAFDEPRGQAEMTKVPFECVRFKHASGGPDTIGVKVQSNGDENVVAVEAVAGMMVKHLGGIAAAKAASEAGSHDAESFFPQDWVIAIPGYYTDVQRRAFLVGCEIAGITGIQRLMHENTATALAYGIFKDIRKEFTADQPTNVMFIDMGATAYSVAIVAFEPGKLTVKSTFFDADLGGRDFDLLIAEWLAEQFETKYKGKLSGKPLEKPKVRIKLLAAAEKMKKTLSPHGVKEARANLECLMDDLDFSCSLKAVDYEKMCKPLLDRLAKPIQQALQESKLSASDLASVEIVGGSTRIGCVKRTISEILGGKQLSTTMNADEAVGRGAALQSAILSPRFKVLPYDIHEFQPFPIKMAWDEETQQGIEVDGDAEGADLPTNSVVMFDRGLNFPVVRRVTLRRSGVFTVNAAYDDASLNYDFPKGADMQVATFSINAPAGEEKKVRVNVKEDINGIISLSSAQMVEEVEVEEPAPAAEGEQKEGEGEESKKKKKITKTNLDFTVHRPSEWSKVDIDKAFEAEVAMSNTDRIFKETSDARNELESYVYEMRDKIISDHHLAPYCTDEEKAAFSKDLEQVESWLYEEGFDATKSVYAEKLAMLKNHGKDIEFRHSESVARPAAVSALQRNIERYRTWLNESQTDDSFAHITDEERQRCHDKCDEISSWTYEMLDKQGSLAANENPVVTVSDLNAKNKELSDVCSPVKHKPAPKPKKEEKPAEAKAEEKPEPMETEEEKPAGDGPTNMEVDPVD